METLGETERVQKHVESVNDTRDVECRREMRGMGKGAMNLVRESGTEFLRRPTHTWLMISCGLVKIHISKGN